MARPQLNSPLPEDRITVICLHCEKPMEVPRKAISFTCKFCHKALRLEDVRFKEFQARRAVETCGIVTIEKKGQVVADRISCGGAIVRGKVKGDVISQGPVLVGPEAEIKGDVTAPTIAIGAGAVLEGTYKIGNWPKNSPPGSTPASSSPASEGPST